MPNRVSKKKVMCCCFSKPEEQEPQVAAVDVPQAESTFEVARVPFSAELPQDLAAGKAICVSGIVLPKCSRFAVNLTCGRGPNVDIAFHFNPRIIQKYVVRNSCINGRWGNEEKTSTVKFPFERNHGKFTLTILLGKQEFLVAVDGVHFCTYQFRVPWEKITGIDVQGMVDVLGVEYEAVEKYPEVGKGTPEARIAEGSKENIETALKTGMDTPVTFSLPTGFRPDWQLEIYGRVKILPHSFYINLQTGAHRWPHPNIPLHLNPRFALSSGEPVFVRNAWIDDGWGQEERTPGFQFEPGSPFTMAIRRGDDHFSVWIDDKLAGEFKFRGDVDSIDTVLIEGDVVIFDVVLQEKNAPLAVLS